MRAAPTASQCGTTPTVAPLSPPANETNLAETTAETTEIGTGDTVADHRVILEGDEETIEIEITDEMTAMCGILEVLAAGEDEMMEAGGEKTTGIGIGNEVSYLRKMCYVAIWRLDVNLTILLKIRAERSRGTNQGRGKVREILGGG